VGNLKPKFIPSAQEDASADTDNTNVNKPNFVPDVTK